MVSSGPCSMNSSVVVVKVTYGGVLKRFNAHVISSNAFEYKLSELKLKIIALFKLHTHAADLILSYVDEEGDVVSLDEDSELLDAAVAQKLNPLRITARPRYSFDAAAPGGNQCFLAHDSLSSPAYEAAVPRPCNLPSYGYQQASQPPWSGLTTGLNISRPAINSTGESSLGTPGGQHLPKGNQNNSPAYVSAPWWHDPVAAPLQGPSSQALMPGAANSELGNASTAGGASTSATHKEAITSGHRHAEEELKPWDACLPSRLKWLNAYHDRAGAGLKNSHDRDPLALLNSADSPDGGTLPYACSSSTSMARADDAVRLQRNDYHFKAESSEDMKLEGCFVRDVTVLDGTVLPPSTPFLKLWRMRNSGSVEWPCGTQLVWVGGDQFANEHQVRLEIPLGGLKANEEIDICVVFFSPPYPGSYISYWSLASPSGQKFGQQVWVLIQVDIPVSSPEAGDINLNLPAEGSNVDELGGTHVDDELLDETINFLLDDFVPAGNAIDDHEVQAAGTADAEPTDDEISHDDTAANPDTKDAAAKPAPGAPPSTADAPPHSDIESDDPVTKVLMQVLEDMGFEQRNLNNKILKLNNNDLELSLDGLCCLNQWDVLLEELEDMGFDDRFKNEKLLEKNHGSITRVVFDLLLEEEAEEEL